MHNRHYRCGPGGWRQPGLYKQAPVNIEETHDGFILQLYAPSLSKENIFVSTQNDILSIRCKTADTTAAPIRFTRREYRPEEIQRQFELKGKVDVDRISAGYSEGVLRIELPKTEAAKKPVRDVPVG